MEADSSNSFERLNQWTKIHANKRMGLIESWSIRARIALSKEAQSHLWRRVPTHWNAYRIMALERKATIDRKYRLELITDPMWFGNEIMGISCTGNTPIIQACEALLFANCPSDYAPQDNLPTVRDALREWALWFDQEYNPEFDRETGAPCKRAQFRVEKTLSQMDARSIESSMAQVEKSTRQPSRRL